MIIVMRSLTPRTLVLYQFSIAFYKFVEDSKSFGLSAQNSKIDFKN